MPKKTKSRSSKKAKQHRQAKARAVRQDRQIDAILEATEAALPAAIAAGQFTVKHGEHAVLVTLEDIRSRVNAELAGDGEEPMDTLSEVADMLRDDAEMGLVLLHTDGLWRLPEEYLPEAGQA